MHPAHFLLFVLAACDFQVQICTNAAASATTPYLSRTAPRTKQIHPNEALTFDKKLLDHHSVKNVFNDNNHYYNRRIAVDIHSYNFDDMDTNKDSSISQVEYCINFFYVFSAKLCKNLFNRRDRDRDGKLNASEIHEPHLKGGKRLFLQLIHPKLLKSPYNDLVGSSFLGEKSDRKAMEYWNKRGFHLWIDPENIVTAISMILDGRVVGWKLHEDWLVYTTFKSHTSNETLMVPVPIVRHLHMHYAKDCNTDIRSLILLLLRERIKVDTMTPYQLEDLPFVAEVGNTFPPDIIYLQAILASSPQLSPFLGLDNRGYSFLHILSEPPGITTSKRLLQVGDHMNYKNLSMKAAFQALSDHPGFTGAVWLGDIFETEYKSLKFISPTFRVIERDWDANGFPGYVIQGYNMRIDEE